MRYLLNTAVLVLLFVAWGCKSDYIIADLGSAPVLSAPFGSKSGGIQAMGGINGSYREKIATSASWVGQIQGYYAINKHFFVEGQLNGSRGSVRHSDSFGISRSSGYAMSAMPGIGLYRYVGIVSLMLSLGVGYQYSYAEFEDVLSWISVNTSYKAEANILPLYEKVGLRLRLGATSPLSVYLGSQFTQQLYAGGLIVVGKSYSLKAKRSEGTLAKPLFGFCYGKPGKTSVFVQTCPGTYSIGSDFKSVGAIDTYNWTAGVTIPLAAK